jgi:hypothetical protein
MFQSKQKLFAWALVRGPLAAIRPLHRLMDLYRPRLGTLIKLGLLGLGILWLGPLESETTPLAQQILSREPRETRTKCEHYDVSCVSSYFCTDRETLKD